MAPGPPDEPAADVVATREALHRVAEHVLAAARWRWDGHIGLGVMPGGFGLAPTIDEVNLGGSAGDADHRAPYLYVGPWRVPPGDRWNEPWGWSVPASEVGDVAGALAVLREGRAALG